MKQIYFSIAMLFIATISFAQQPIITSIVDGTCSGGTPKLIEIYADGTVDFTQFTLEKSANGGTFGSGFDLSPFGTRTDSFVYVYSGPEATLNAEFPGIAAADYQVANTANNNGDDAIRIIETTSMTVIDTYGTQVDGTGETWEYLDSYAKRVDGTGPDATFNQANWTTTAPNSLDNQCGTTTFETIVGTGSYSATANTNPTITLTSPNNGSTLPSGTTSVDVTWTSLNLPAGGTFTVTVNGTATSNATSPFAVSVSDGVTYAVTVDMLDGTTVVATDSTSFDVSFPCDLQLGTITETCQTSTSGVDLYDVTIDYTAGGTSTYTIDTAGNGTVGGDDPSTVAAGQITITGVTEGVDFTVTVTGDPANSSCSINRNISSPACLANVTCANPGDIILTEIMQNPSAAADNEGEYFEVYNTTNTAIDMLGYEIVDLTNSAENFTIITSVIVPANGYAVFVANADTNLNGGITPAYVYDGTSTFLGNGSDEISIQCSGTVIDEVSWDNGATFPDGNGVSMELALSKYNATDNDLGANWGPATSTYGAGDLGTPGAANDFTLSNNQFTMNSVKMFPNPLNGTTLNFSVENGNAIDVIIYSALGQQVINKSGVTNTLNVSSLDAGLYIVKISQEGNSQTRKLVVQ
ncbi:lamin tail domain-containing protein [Nonlabens sp.]|uniref:lamin tail domain-containing protein n=1 Tax=Nonlabens sp. TaxID=1888209 RepID=UPI003F6A0EBC